MRIRSTTILAILKDGKLVLAGDGQVTLGSNIIKSRARKIRKFYQNKVLGGFAGQTADALTLFDRFEAKLNSASGNLKKAAVELAKDWRMDKVLRRLEAMLLVGDKEQILIISGQGDVLEPDEPVAAIGSGSAIARAAALALYRKTDLSAEEIALEAMKIASEHCVYTNDQIVLEILP